MLKGIAKRLALALVAFCSCMTEVYAVAPGFYAGVMLGPSTNSASPQIVSTAPPEGETAKANPRSKQFGTRLFAGNKINQYFGIEGGLTYYSDINFKPNNRTGSPDSTVRIRTFDIEPMGYFSYKQFDFYGKAGASAIYMTTSGGLTATGRSSNKTSFRPILGIGASYTFNQRWVGELSYTRTLVGSFINNVSLIAIGFSYHFVDVYCGQFLCDD